MDTIALDPVKCFNLAISKGILSENPSDSNYAGNYMYMYTTDFRDFRKHSFKNIDTRKYIDVNSF